MRLKKILLLLAFVTFINIQYAQTLFSRVYAKTSNEFLSSTITPLSDGSVILSGIHNGNNLVMKIDNNGEVLWSKDLGSGSYESGAMCKYDENTFEIAASVTTDETSFQNLFCIKMNESGDTLWSRTYDFFGNVEVNWVSRTLDNGFVIAGTIQNSEQPYTHILVVKLDESGNYMWSKRFMGGIYGNKALAIDQSEADSALYITGHFTDNNPFRSDAFLMKLNIEGEIDFTNTYSYAGNEYGIGKGISVFGDKIVMLASLGPMCLIGIDNEGNISWVNAGYNDGYEFCGFDIRKWRVEKDISGNYKFLSGDYIYETDSLGNINHSMFFEMCVSDFTTVNGITTVSGNGPMIGVKENTYPQIGLINYDSLYQTSGMCVWESSDFNYNVELETNTRAVIEIDHEYEHINYQPEITSSIPNVEDKCVAFLGAVSEVNKKQFNVYPNPVKDQIFISTDNSNSEFLIRFVDINGNIVIQENLKGSSNSLNLKGLSSGIFTINIIAETTESHRIIVSK